MEYLMSCLSDIFSWLMDYTIDISILISVLFLIRAVTSKKFPAWWHYSLWIILLLRMAIPLELGSPLTIPDVIPISINEKLFETIIIEVNPEITELAPEISSGAGGWHVQVDNVLLFLWLSGGIILGIFILIKNIKFWNVIRTEPLLTDTKMLDLLEICRLRMDSYIPLKITVTDRIKSPALFGYIRPRLLLPPGVLEKLNDSDLSYIFMHELCHLKRHDIGVSWVVSFLLIFQWFNPFVWLAFYQMKIDQETACDESVISRMQRNQTIDYAGTIIGFLENFYRNRKLPALVGILENQGQLKKRITLIINYRKNSEMMLRFSTALLIAIGLFSFFFAGIEKEKTEQANLNPQIFQALPYEVQKDLARLTGDEKYNSIVVRFPDGNQKSFIALLDKEAFDEMVRNKLAPDSRENPKEAGSNDIKNEIILVKPEVKNRVYLARLQGSGIEIDKEYRITGKLTQKKPADITGNSMKDERETVRFAGGNLMAFTDFFNGRFKTSPEKKDVSGSNPYEANEREPFKKRYNTGGEKGVNYFDFASAIYYKTSNQEYAEAAEDLLQNKPGKENINDPESVYEKPEIVSLYPLKYPYKAKEKGIEGRVILRFTVDTKGRVNDPQVISAKPEGIFEKAAIYTVTRYRFKPAKKGGESVNSIVKLPVSFGINDKLRRFARI